MYHPQDGGPSSLDAPDATTATCPNCCCGVERVTIENVRYVGAVPETHGGKTSFNGHAFDFKIEMRFCGSAGAKSGADCTLEWWETNNLPSDGISRNVETDMYAYLPVSNTFAPWNKRPDPCPGGGVSTVTITDFPSLPIKVPGITGVRTLKFRLVVKSGAGCDHGLRSATAYAVQVLTLENSKLVAASFTINPSAP